MRRYGECVLNRTKAIGAAEKFPYGAGLKLCCMPWTLFETMMNTTYAGVVYLADQVNGAGKSTLPPVSGFDRAEKGTDGVACGTLHPVATHVCVC